MYSRSRDVTRDIATGPSQEREDCRMPVASVKGNILLDVVCCGKMKDDTDAGIEVDYGEKRSSSIGGF